LISDPLIFVGLHGIAGDPAEEQAIFLITEKKNGKEA
jgi:hypothetical protein